MRTSAGPGRQSWACTGLQVCGAVHVPYESDPLGGVLRLVVPSFMESRLIRYCYQDAVNHGLRHTEGELWEPTLPRALSTCSSCMLSLHCFGCLGLRTWTMPVWISPIWPGPICFCALSFPLTWCHLASTATHVCEWPFHRGEWQHSSWGIMSCTENWVWPVFCRRSMFLCNSSYPAVWELSDFL